MTTDTLDLVHQLTRDHKTTIENDDGTKTYADIPSHLDQLQEAIHGSAIGGGGSSGKNRAPISAKALDLWQEIAETTLQYWPGYGRPHLAKTPLPTRIQQWASVAINSNDTQDEKTLNMYANRWIREIQALFEPSIELSSPCPECGEQYIWRYDGVENIKKRCLQYNQHGAWCNNCGQTWNGKASMVNLARIINEDQPVNGTPTHTSQTGK